MGSGAGGMSHNIGEYCVLLDAFADISVSGLTNASAIGANTLEMYYAINADNNIGVRGTVDNDPNGGGTALLEIGVWGISSNNGNVNDKIGVLGESHDNGRSTNNSVGVLGRSYGNSVYNDPLVPNTY